MDHQSPNLILQTADNNDWSNPMKYDALKNRGEVIDPPRRLRGQHEVKGSGDEVACLGPEMFSWNGLHVTDC